MRFLRRESWGGGPEVDGTAPGVCWVVPVAAGCEVPVVAAGAGVDEVPAEVVVVVAGLAPKSPPLGAAVVVAVAPVEAGADVVDVVALPKKFAGAAAVVAGVVVDDEAAGLAPKRPLVGAAGVLEAFANMVPDAGALVFAAGVPPKMLPVEAVGVDSFSLLPPRLLNSPPVVGAEEAGVASDLD